ncbi:hypothetical protein DFH09DRAFT_1093617 [Mycena vulgaris]|nr:hypothetical protein DFH09DRAFT_1093617 [Mycena vulgaris]
MSMSLLCFHHNKPDAGGEGPPPPTPGPTLWLNTQNLANNLHLTERERNARYQRDQQLETELLLRQEQAAERNTRADRHSQTTTLPVLSIPSFPSTPTLTTPSTLTPETPSPPTPTRSSPEMSPALELFRGDARGEKPHYWLRKLQGSMSFDAEEEEKLHRFQMGLAPGTVADRWLEAAVPYCGGSQH